jgi:multicomponent Na+:H+ antiporter subunit E
MNMFLLNILLAATWGMATGLFTVSNLAVGFVLGFLILRFNQRLLGPSPYFAKVPQVLRFALRYVWELFLANLRVASDVLRVGVWSRAGGSKIDSGSTFPAPVAPASYVSPGVVGITLDACTDLEIVLLANLLTLTPGSVSLDLSEDRRVLYVHAMYIDGGDIEAYRQSVKAGLERRVLELLR